MFIDTLWKTASSSLTPFLDHAVLEYYVGMRAVLFKFWKTHMYDEERMYIILSSDRFSRVSRIRLLCCPLAFGHLYSRSAPAGYLRLREFGWRSAFSVIRVFFFLI